MIPTPDERYTFLVGDVIEQLQRLPSDSVHCVVCSPPYYGLRMYLPDGDPDAHKQIGLERTLPEYLDKMVGVFREVRRVLRPDGTAWVNMGDSYVAGPTGRQNGSIKKDRQHLKELGERLGCGGGNKYSSEEYQESTNAMIAKGGRYRVDNMRKDLAKERGGLKAKDLMMVPARLAIALQEDGWYLRSEITWCKRAPMPESCTDRPTSATERIYLLARSPKYYYDADAVREPNVDSLEVWQAKRGANAKYQEGGLKANHLATSTYEPAGRNMWNYLALPADRWRLRHDLTPEQRSYVLRRMLDAGLLGSDDTPENSNGHSGA